MLRDAGVPRRGTPAALGRAHPAPRGTRGERPRPGRACRGTARRWAPRSTCWRPSIPCRGSTSNARASGCRRRSGPDLGHRPRARLRALARAASAALLAASGRVPTARHATLAVGRAVRAPVSWWLARRHGWSPTEDGETWLLGSTACGDGPASALDVIGHLPHEAFRPVQLTRSRRQAGCEPSMSRTGASTRSGVENLARRSTVRRRPILDPRRLLHRPRGGAPLLHVHRSSRRRHPRGREPRAAVSRRGDHVRSMPFAGTAPLARRSRRGPSQRRGARRVGEGPGGACDRRRRGRRRARRLCDDLRWDRRARARAHRERVAPGDAVRGSARDPDRDRARPRRRAASDPPVRVHPEAAAPEAIAERSSLRPGRVRRAGRVGGRRG